LSIYYRFVKEKNTSFIVFDTIFHNLLTLSIKKFKLCSVDKIAAQEVSVKAQLPVMRMVFSMWMLDENCSILLLEQVQKVYL
jgi:hypothetical protein